VICDATVQVTCLITTESQEIRIVVDYAPILVVSALIATIAAVSLAFEYYRRILIAQAEYKKAKGSVEDIILSVNRELKREAAKIDLIEFRIAGYGGREDTISKKVDAVEKRVSPLENQVTSVSKNGSEIVNRIVDVNAKVSQMETLNETLQAKIAGFEEQMRNLSIAPEIQREPVITIRRDKAMGALTETEIAVLEMLVTQGSKTAPEIKERVHLSREHTARLMKKLYESGYLERETNKIPFSYSVKKEMETLLKKPEREQT
jgi:hypothetical protein